MADGRDPETGRFTAGNPGKQPGTFPKAPAEARAFLRSVFEKPDTRAAMEERIVKDLRSGDGAFAARMFAHAYGAPPAELNVDARGDLRTALLAAFASRDPGAPPDGEPA